MSKRRRIRPEWLTQIPTTDESKQILADTMALKGFAKAARMLRMLESGMLPPDARAEGHMMADINAAMSNEGFHHAVEAIAQNDWLEQQERDAEEVADQELLSQVRIKNAMLWARYRN